MSIDYSDLWIAVVTVTTISPKSFASHTFKEPGPYGEARENLLDLLGRSERHMPFPAAECSLVSYSLKRLTIDERDDYLRTKFGLKGVTH